MLVNSTEQQLYSALRTAINSNPNYTLLTKVRVGDIITKEHYAHFFNNELNTWHADFVICTGHFLTPILVVELDGPTHLEPHRADRDATVDRAYQSANLPILHIPPQQTYDPIQLQQAITHYTG